MDLTSISLETITQSEQTNYRVMEIGKIKDNFNQKNTTSTIFNKLIKKYLTCLDYTDKILTVFLTVISGTNISANVKGKKTITWFNHFCVFFSILSKFWNC